MPLTPDRRQFAKTAIAGVAAAAAVRTSSAKLTPIPPGIKIAASSGATTSDEQMKYLKQLGVTWVSLAPSVQEATAEGFVKIREKWEAMGLKVYNIGSG